MLIQARLARDGQNNLVSGFNFHVEVHLDIGIFVSGESSALMKSIEGNPPEPRPKYIRTSVKGIWEMPSVLNNVETWANVPLIIDKGSEWYTRTGTERSKGTKLISLSGNIVNTGVKHRCDHSACGGDLFPPPGDVRRKGIVMTKQFVGSVDQMNFHMSNNDTTNRDFDRSVSESPEARFSAKYTSWSKCYAGFCLSTRMDWPAFDLQELVA